MKRILIGFLPWIICYILIGANQSHIDLAIIVSFFALIITGARELKKKFVLAWGSLLYFSLMLPAIVLFKNQWITTHVWILSNAMLAVIAWFSLVIHRPFTLQYAREQVPKTSWNHPTFVAINQILTTVWACVFSACTLIHISQLYISILPACVFPVITNGLSILAIFFTMNFPNYYRRHRKQQRMRNNAVDCSTFRT